MRRARGLQVEESRALGKMGWLAHGFSTRPGGESLLDGKPALNLGFTDWDERERVANNRAKFESALGARDGAGDDAAVSFRRDSHRRPVCRGEPILQKPTR